MLADDGVYLASESTFSRVLRDEGQAAHRGRAKKPRTVRPPTTESTDGLQHVEYTGALDAGYTASTMKAAADKLQEIVGAGALRMTVGALGFATGQALLDWLKATKQPFDASKVQQQA